MVPPTANTVSVGLKELSNESPADSAPFERIIAHVT